ncbi:MAG: RDD family protein [Acidimicrobiia bacterium]
MSRRGAIRDPRAAELQGRPAGIVSRLAADAIDLGVLQVLFFGCLVAIAVVRFLVTRHDFSVGAPNPAVTVAVEWTLLVLYLGSGWSTTGRTVGKTVLGLRVTRRDGATVPPLRAFGRAVMCASFYPGLLWMLVSRNREALHDIAFRTRVRYDWDPAPIPDPRALGRAR